MARSAISASLKALPERNSRTPPHQAGLRHTAIIVAVALLLWPSIAAGPVRAEPTPASETAQVDASDWAVKQSDLCAVALRQAEQRHHLPANLLETIAKAESGRPITSLTDIRPWPWTIDADGTGLFLDSKAAAIAWMHQQTARHGFIDVGCMQVDLHYHPNAFASLEDAFDPADNADYAARLLTELYHGEAGNNWDIAVGLYHSHTPILAAQYRDRVALIGAGVLKGVLAGVPLYVRAIRQGTLRLALGGGRTALLNVHRQPAARSRHPYTACQIAQVLGSYLNGGPKSGGCVTASR
jgi:hypothetical protein